MTTETTAKPGTAVYPMVAEITLQESITMTLMVDIPAIDPSTLQTTPIHRPINFELPVGTRFKAKIDFSVGGQ